MRLAAALVTLVLLASPPDGLASGFLIYREQAFHTDAQAKLVEYQTAEIIPQLVTVWLKSGERLDVAPGKCPLVLPFPDSQLERPDAMPGVIDKAIVRFPQFAERLRRLKSAWEQTLHAHSPDPSPDESGERFVARDGTTYAGVTRIHPQPNGLIVTHRNGVSRVSFYNLTDDQIQKYHLDRRLADAYSAQQRAIALETAKTQARQVTAQLHEKEMKELDKENGIPATGTVVQVMPGEGIVIRGFRIREYLDTEQRVEDCLANHATDPRIPKRMIRVQVRKQALDPIGDQATNLCFVRCATKSFADGDRFSAKIYRMGTYDLAGPCQKSRRIPQFTDSFADYYDEYQHPRVEMANPGPASPEATQTGPQDPPRQPGAP